jgi:hypothetical protein
MRTSLRAKDMSWLLALFVVVVLVVLMIGGTWIAGRAGLVSVE